MLEFNLQHTFMNQGMLKIAQTTRHQGMGNLLESTSKQIQSVGPRQEWWVWTLPLLLFLCHATLRWFSKRHSPHVAPHSGQSCFWKPQVLSNIKGDTVRYNPSYISILSAHGVKLRSFVRLNFKDDSPGFVSIWTDLNKLRKMVYACYLSILDAEAGG